LTLTPPSPYQPHALIIYIFSKLVITVEGRSFFNYLGNPKEGIKTLPNWGRVK